MGITIISIVLMAAAVGLIFGRKKQEDKLFQMKLTETFLVKDLLQEAKDVEEGLGEKGSFNKPAEVKGKTVCDNPMTSELAQIQCVDYTMTIARKWEEEYWDTDSEGNRHKKTRQGSDTVASNARSVPFYVEDSTGRIKVNPEGASLIREKVYSKFERGEPGGTSIRIGGFSMNLGSISPGSGRKTIGYSYEESAIPLNRDVYILGEAADSSGEVRMQKPSEKGQKYIVSVKSEEELTRKTQGAIKGLLIGAIACGVLGVAGLILNIAGVFS